MVICSKHFSFIFLLFRSDWVNGRLRAHVGVWHTEGGIPATVAGDAQHHRDTVHSSGEQVRSDGHVGEAPPLAGDTHLNQDTIQSEGRKAEKRKSIDAAVSTIYVKMENVYSEVFYYGDSMLVVHGVPVHLATNFQGWGGGGGGGGGGGEGRS